MRRAALALALVVSGALVACASSRSAPSTSTTRTGATSVVPVTTPAPTSASAPSASPSTTGNGRVGTSAAVPTVAPPATTRVAPPEPTTTPAPGADRSVRSVDFGAFTYGIAADGGPVTLSGGKVTLGTGPADLAFVEAELVDVAYGDLDGDGREEAAVELRWGYGGTGSLTDVFVYRWSGSSAVLAARSGVGDRAFDGVRRAAVADGTLVVDRFAGQAACCPETVVHGTYRLSGSALVATATPQTIAVVDLFNPPTAGADVAIRFLAGTDTAVVFGDGNVRGTFDARAGQVVTLSLEPVVGATGVVDLLRGTTVLGTARVGAPLRVTLPASGGFALVIRRDGGAAGEVSVDADLTIR